MFPKKNHKKISISQKKSQLEKPVKKGKVKP